MIDTNTISVKCCFKCDKIKMMEEFIKNRNICKNCNNEKRRSKYNTNEEHRLKMIQSSTQFKHTKCVERQLKKRLIQEEIGLDNKQCKYCLEVQPKDRFRKNRLKCKDCETNEPVDKFKRIVRTRIFNSLKHKDKHTIEYLGCSSIEYIDWILHNKNEYTLENQGEKWHIDHVIPLSRFNLDNEEEQLIAFNWRNTMPLSPRENLTKNNKIIVLQIEEHLKHLLEYHSNKNIVLPTQFIDLFAKHLVAGSPLEPLLPL